MKRYLFPVAMLVVLISGCAGTPPVTALPAASQAATSIPTPVPSETPIPVMVEPSIPLELTDYTGIFLDRLGGDEASCMPDKIDQCVSVYVYDLDHDRELVAINEDVPLQYASAFKGPLLVYFLEHCKKYWDIYNPDWEIFFRESASLNPWYMSDEYRQLLRVNLSDVTNWNTLDTFLYSNRAVTNGLPGAMDERYLILQQVYKMVTQSNNYTAGIVLKFVYENCLPGPSVAIEMRCGGSNAITEFNLWFNGFSSILYSTGEPGRGLNSWDVIITTNSSGETQVTRMATYGIADQCAIQTALLPCADNLPIPNVWTARDLFKFYHALFRLEDANEKKVALDILAIDDPGASRGYLKNMARDMGAVSMSKNGYFGSILVDAGIVEYQGYSHVIAVLSYDAVDSIVALFGQYDTSGNRAGSDEGLLQELLEGTLPSR